MKKRKIFILLILALMVSFLFYYLSTHHFELKTFIAEFKSFGIWTSVVFVLAYAVLPVLFMPITPLSLASGAIFGPVIGSAITLFGQVASASIAFFISRYLLKDFVDKKSHDKILVFQNKLAEFGWQFVLVSRFTPIFPFCIQNHLFGVTKISYKTYILASLPALIPAAIIFTYAGYAGKSLLTGDKTAMTSVIIAIVLFIAMSFIPKFIKLPNKK